MCNCLKFWNNISKHLQTELGNIKLSALKYSPELWYMWLKTLFPLKCQQTAWSYFIFSYRYFQGKKVPPKLLISWATTGLNERLRSLLYPRGERFQLCYSEVRRAEKDHAIRHKTLRSSLQASPELGNHPTELVIGRVRRYCRGLMHHYRSCLC